MELTWTPAPRADSARVGHDGTPLTDYLLHPPPVPGVPPPVDGPDLPRLWRPRRARVGAPDPADQRRAALRALIDAAFGP